MFEILHGDKRLGPLSSSQIKQLAQQQKLLPEMQIRKHPDGEWQSITSVKGLEFTVAAKPLNPPTGRNPLQVETRADMPIESVPPRPQMPSPPAPMQAIAISATSVSVAQANGFQESPQMKVPIRPKPPSPVVESRPKPAPIRSPQPKQELVVSPQYEVMDGYEAIDGEDSFVEDYAPRAGSENAPCPFCGESIKRVARKCKHCGEYLDPSLRTAHQPQATVVNVMNNNVAAATVTAPRTPLWSPGVAILLSFIFPGLGQLYKGEVAAGVVWMFATIVGYMMFVFPGLVIHLCCIIAAGTGDPYRRYH